MSDTATGANLRQLITERADKITPRKLRWLWPERIPLGNTTIFAGMPGAGKSLATVDIAARVTTATNYPDVKNPLPASGVLFIAEEDDPQDILVPRLKVACADLFRVHFLTGVREKGKSSDDHLRLDRDIGAIDKFLTENPDVRLIVIDPISNHLGSVPMTDEQEVRRILGPLNEVAKAHNVAIICVMHLNKKEGLSPIHRVGGAGAFIGVARASWLFGRNPEGPSERCMLPLKNNYGRKSSGLGYRIDEKPVKIESEDVLTPYIDWCGEIDLNVDEILSPPKMNSSSLGEAKLFIQGFLGSGPQDASTVEDAASARGISKRTLDRAKGELGVESRKKGLEGWEWVLPGDQPKNANESYGTESTDTSVGNLQAVTLRE